MFHFHRDQLGIYLSNQESYSRDEKSISIKRRKTFEKNYLPHEPALRFLLLPKNMAKILKNIRKKNSFWTDLVRGSVSILLGSDRNNCLSYMSVSSKHLILDLYNLKSQGTFFCINNFSKKKKHFMSRI